MSAGKRGDAGSNRATGDGPAAAGARCLDCGGSGGVLLLVSTVPCQRCGGTGHVATSARNAAVVSGAAPAPVDAAPADAPAEPRPGSRYTSYPLPVWPDEPAVWSIAWG